MENSNVDTETGHLNIKKREAWINTFTPLISYVFRCNTDVTSLRSGTAIKAMLIYVTDYITKPGLKMHAIFDCIWSIYQRSRDEPGDPNKTRKERMCKLMTQMVNVLGAKTELGSPMICTYLLGLPDHYTNHTFVTFYWKSFVSEMLNCWKGDDDLVDSVKVTLRRSKGSIMGVSPVEDYVHRPLELESMSLYDWMCLCKRSSDSSACSSCALDEHVDERDTDEDEREIGTGDLDGDSCCSDDDIRDDPGDLEDASDLLDDFIVEDDESSAS